MQFINYLIAGGILFLLALGLAFLPEKNNREELSPEFLLQDVNREVRFLSPDEVADRLINQDPALVLIDLRSEEEYNAFSLPAALNFPLEKVFEPETQELLDRDELDFVFYSNDHIKAEQAWLLNRRKLHKNIYILEGGLNQWIQDIIRPEEPDELAPAEVHAQYQLRLAARNYFLGGSRPIQPGEYKAEAQPTRAKRPKPSIPIAPKPVKQEVVEVEGC
jgi:3-mercaptopyruvate sulfurtransferase SseA